MNNKNKFKYAKIIKNMDSLRNLVYNIRFNYSVLLSTYEKRHKIKDIEYKQISCLLNNFILTSSIIKQYILSYEKDLSSAFIKTKKYIKTINFLFEDEWYLILLGLRNYLQHIFELKLGFGNLMSESNEEDLFIASFTLIKHEDAHKTKENIAMYNYFKCFTFLPIMDFASVIMELIDNFYEKYNKIIHSHYKSALAKYSNTDIDQYAMDMHEIYYNNINSFKKEF